MEESDVWQFVRVLDYVKFRETLANYGVDCAFAIVVIWFCSFD
jgi:hypothetical protein